VRLNFFRVTEWSGELHPHEGQEFAWQGTSSSTPSLTIPRRERELAGGNVSVFPLLPANVPILKTLELPTLYAISNAAELGVELFLARLQTKLNEGLKLVQLREKNLSREDLRELAIRVIDLAHAHGAKVLLNGDVELAHEVGADGVQLTSTQLAELTDRPLVDWCGASCHNLEDLHRAQKLGCDFALLSPVLPTQSHPGAPHLGWENFAAIAAGSTIPVYALGGLTHADMQTAWRHGAHGISLLRQAW
jgi:8-oxo-dGTP diphosphatase